MKKIDSDTLELGSQLALAHWQYIRSVLVAHDTCENEMKIACYHYFTAFLHGYKHGLEDVQNPDYSSCSAGGSD